MTEPKYKPVFAGRTEDNEKIVIYQSVDVQDQYHILRDRGELRAFSPGSEITVDVNDHDALMRVTIVSPEWSGTAVGTRWDLMEVPNL